MIEDVLIVDSELIKSIEWTGDSAQYDKSIRELVSKDQAFIVINPWVSDSKPFYFINQIPNTKKCVVWTYGNEWVAKHFPAGWKKQKGYLSIEIVYPKMEWSKNAALAKVYDFNTGIFRKFKPDPWQCQNELIWYVDPGFSQSKEKIWAFKCKPADRDPISVIDMGWVEPNYPKRFDVIFISYAEPNAETNWQRVLSKAPYAKRIHGVSGIFEAHRMAAEISQTEMFFVIDGDAWIVDDFNFNHRPDLFDRDVTFVWKSKNPYNSLDYGYGGIKLFNKYRFLRTKKWRTLDLTTTISKNLKVINQVSVVTNFNVDPFSTWRSAFRESVKLCLLKDQERLSNWVTQPGEFVEYALHGIQDGVDFYNNNCNNLTGLRKINDFNWLKSYWKKMNHE